MMMTDAEKDTVTMKMDHGHNTGRDIIEKEGEEWTMVESKEQRVRRKSLEKHSRAEKSGTAVSTAEASARGEREEKDRRAALTAMTGRGRRSETGGEVRVSSREGDRTKPGLHGAPGVAAGERDARAAGETQQQDKMKQAAGITYDRDLTVSLEVTGQDEVPVLDLMKAIRALCGGLIACRATGARTYEITMSHAKGKERLLDGFKIGNTSILVKELCNDELMVSFLNLPAYISDEGILQKLEGWGVSAASTIRRRMWPGTQIADGTRFLKVKFTDKVQSLPYSVRFETVMGPEYFRVIHDRQTKVCRMCLQPGHILRDCPEFSCHKCGVQGHYARECSRQQKKNNKCEVCCNLMEDCSCNYSESDVVAGSGSEALSTEAEDMSEEEEEEEEGEEAGEGGSGIVKGAGSEGLPQGRAPSPPKDAQCLATKMGRSREGLSSGSGPREGGRGKSGDGLAERPEPSLALESMQMGETLSNLQQEAATPPRVPALSSPRVVCLQGKSDSDSEMDVATIQSIRKQHTSNLVSRTKKRKKEKKKNNE